MDGSDPCSPTFWQRQFHFPTTKPQRLFDAVFGIVLPVVCLAADPVVFRGTVGWAWLHELQAAAWILILAEAAFLTLWLFRRPSGRLSKAFYLGVFSLGALLAFLLGLAILPLTLLGTLMMGLGLPGLTPFVTAFVYLRNARWAASGGTSRGSFAAATCGALLVLACAGLSQGAKGRAVRAVVENPSSKSWILVVRGMTSLGWENADPLVDAWSREPKESRKRQLADAYRRITGEEVEVRWARLRD